MTPTAFWTLAGKLLEGEKNDAGFRTCVSRSYYAAYHEAVAFLSSLGINLWVKTAECHGLVIDILMKLDDNEPVKQAAAKLNDLRGRRNKADYRIDDKRYESPEYAETAYLDAGDVMAKLNTCGTNPSRITAISSILVPWANELKLGKPAP